MLFHKNPDRPGYDFQLNDGGPRKNKNAEAEKKYSPPSIKGKR